MADTESLSLRLPTDTLAGLREEAEEQGRTVNNLASFVLRRFVRKAKVRRAKGEA
jgi:hypothetical protein